MKNKMKLLLFGAAIMLVGGFSACSDDDLGESIFDTKVYPLDKSSYSFPLDSFCKAEFLKPYNMQFKYRMEDVGSDMNKNLVPATYDNSVKLAVLCKYLWFDVYQKLGGDEFLKLYSPRIIHLIGSPAYNPTSGTETLGTAEGGVKITLYKVNVLDERDIDLMNEYFFHVMHHEFAHILDQTHLRPIGSFDILSNGHYDPLDWQNKHDSLTASWGFVTPYASEAAREDWVETMSTYITSDETTWNRLLNSAYYDWEEIDILEDDLNKDYYKKIKPGCDMDSIGYLNPQKNGEYKIVRKVIKRNADGSAAVDENKKIIFEDQSQGGMDGINGKQLILDKLDLVRTWLRDYFNVDLDALRYEVQHRQYASDSEGNFIKDSYGRYVNLLVQDRGDGTTLMDELLEQVNRFKALQ